MYSLEEINNMSEPYELFDGDLESVETQYVELMKQYHPHLNKQQQLYIDAAKKINFLFKRAEENMKNGTWTTSEFLRIPLNNGKTYTMKYSYAGKFELGNMYIGEKKILYLFNRENRGLASNAIKRIKNIKYKSDDIKREFYRYIPKVIDTFNTANKKVGMVIEKDEDLILLRDYVAKNKDKISIETTGWILRNLYNLYCFINFNELNHNGITMDNYFISTKNHWGALLGGWWYTVNEGEELIGVSKGLEIIVPEMMRISNRSNIILDLEAIKLLGSILIVGKAESKTGINPDIPVDVKLWLRTAVSDNPFLEYIKWSKLIMNLR